MQMRISDYSETEAPLTVSADTKAVRSAVKTGEAVTSDGYTVKIDRNGDKHKVTVSRWLQNRLCA